MAEQGKGTSYDGGPVGYGKPPVEHQFKKGSRKPIGSGRKDGGKNSRTIIQELLAEPVTVSLSGTLQTMSKRELMIRLGYEKATKASSVNEMVALIRLYEKLAPQSVDPLPPLRVQSIPGDENL